jgi:hypothetical protein
MEENEDVREEGFQNKILDGASLLRRDGVLPHRHDETLSRAR